MSQEWSGVAAQEWPSVDARRRTGSDYDPGLSPQVAAIASTTHVPTGLIAPYAGATAPTNWLLCDGGQYSKEVYVALYAVIGTTYGETNGAGGAGTTHFRVPDLRQRFPLGKAASGTGATLGGTGGAIDHEHTFTGSAVTSGSGGGHSHTIGQGNDATRNAASDASATAELSRAAHNHGGSTGSESSHTHSVTAQGTNSTNNAPFIALNYIIRT